MSNVTAIASGMGNSHAVFNHNNSSPAMFNINARPLEGYSNIAVYKIDSSPTMINVTASASGGESKLWRI